MVPVLYVVIPCYNEEKVLPVSSDLFLDELNHMIDGRKISGNSRLLFVDDGSSDSTWSIILELSEQDCHIIGIRQSRNMGHQHALLAGMMESLGRADAVISVDCDGQDDISAMRAMVDKYQEGADIVYGVRSSRKSDSFLKRSTAEGFYRLLSAMGVDVVFNHADYRLVSARALDEFARFEEVNLFLRGIFPMLGFETVVVEYERRERLAGKTHYPLRKMISLAMDGITSLSVRPLRLIATMGLLTSLFSLLGIIWSVVIHFTGRAEAGWPSIISVVCFIGGVQLLSLGVLGEYIGKIYMESKHRPRYIIRDRTWKDRER